MSGVQVALTGHRVLGKDFSAEKAKDVFLRLIREHGAETFYCGMALGFDLACCEILLQLKKDFPLRIVACIPCAGQSDSFPPAQKKRYQTLLSACDERVVLHEKYEEGCMFERNRYMADRCDVLVAYLREKRGGTYYTVRYAEKKGKEILCL